MKFYRNILSGFLMLTAATIAIVIFSCNSPVEPIENNNPSISYTVSGGFLGIFYQVSIDNSGLASLESIYPALQLHLSEDEHANLKSYLKGFENFKDSYPGSCDDDFHYKITLRTYDKERTVEFDGCSADEYPELNQFKYLTESLRTLMDRIYNEKASWQGLTYSFYTDKSIYAPGDTITFFCKISNPSNLDKCIYFRNKYHIQFSLSSNFIPTVQIFNPDDFTAAQDTSYPSNIKLAPGEEIIVLYAWDQSYSVYHDKSYSKLPAGKYSARISLLGGMSIYRSYPAKYDIPIEIK